MTKETEINQRRSKKLMEALYDPYCPGAGQPPSVLAGRGAFLSEAEITIQRAKMNRPVSNHIFTGLRGVGKTVLLLELEKLSEKHGCYPTSLIESDTGKDLPNLLVPRLYQIMIKLDNLKKAQYNAKNGLRILRSFASAFSVKMGSVEVCVKDEVTGDLSIDLPDLFIEMGRIAKENDTAIVIIIDELQCLSPRDFSALILALHKISQRRLPIAFFGAGLPQLPKLAGEAKSYAERLFKYSTVDRLIEDDAIQAIVEPAMEEGVEYTTKAIELILRETKGYPYYLQLWGSEAWKSAITSPIEIEDIEAATASAITILDQGIFATRLQKLTDRQQEYARAMADKKLPAKSADVAARLGLTVEQAAAARNELILKGMAYSPKRGLIDFTVPLFDAFMRRQGPLRKSVIAKTPKAKGRKTIAKPARPA